MVVGMLSLAGLVRAEPALDQLQNCANGGGGCFGASGVQPVPVDADGHPLSTSSPALAPSSARAVGGQAVPTPPSKPAQMLHNAVGFVERHKKLIMGLSLAGVGAYVGFTQAGAWGLLGGTWGLLGGPWGAAVMGAGIGLLVGMIVLPKIIAFFHHPKSD